MENNFNIMWGLLKGGFSQELALIVKSVVLNPVRSNGGTAHSSINSETLHQLHGKCSYNLDLCLENLRKLEALLGSQEPTGEEEGKGSVD